MESKKVYRDQTDKVFAGVCSGLATYFDLDPLLVRIVFVLLALFGGGGVLIYIILWIVIPRKPVNFTYAGYSSPVTGEPDPSGSASAESQEPPVEEPRSNSLKGSLIGGIILVLLGILFLLDEFVRHFELGKLWPVILIVIGLLIIGNTVNRKKN